MSNPKSEKNIPHFHGWKNVKEGFYTKTMLRKEFGLKPFNEDEPDATAKLMMGGKWKDFVLYHVDNCIVISKRKVKELPVTPENLAQALYLINKSAKVSRDTKNENYDKRRHGIVKAAKTRQNKLYELKDAALKKLIQKGLVTTKGYHLINESYFILHELEGFSFHQPTTKAAIDNLKNLGEIHNQISAEKTINTSINFFEAENLLNRFISVD